MLFLFRNNQVTSAVTLAVYVALTHAAAIFGVQQPNPTNLGIGGTLYQVCFHWALQNSLASALSAAILVFIQALLVNNLVDEFRLMNERNWLPALFYVLVTAAIPDFLWLTPPLLAVTFIPVGLRRILRTYKAPQATGLVFDAGFWLAVSSLFYPPAGFLLLAGYFGIVHMRSFQIKEQIVFLVGACIPYILSWVGFFWFDRGFEFWTIQTTELLGIYSFKPDLTWANYLKNGLLALIYVAVLLNFNQYYHRTLIQTQKAITILYWFMFAGLFTLVFRREIPLAHNLLLMPSAGILLSFSFFSIRLPLIAEILHLVLLGWILLLQYFPGVVF